ncbi:hypothetical protein OAT67_08465, partial [Bacteriovoracaceae bacterium]|nr:hypothetical protein [Bacteriovoracaceae bacterium]
PLCERELSFGCPEFSSSGLLIFSSVEEEAEMSWANIEFIVHKGTSLFFDKKDDSRFIVDYSDSFGGIENFSFGQVKKQVIGSLQGDIMFYGDNVNCISGASDENLGEELTLIIQNKEVVLEESANDYCFYPSGFFKSGGRLLKDVELINVAGVIKLYTKGTELKFNASEQVID